MKTARQIRALATATVCLDDFSTPAVLRFARGDAAAITEEDHVTGWVAVDDPGTYSIDVPGLVSREKVPRFPLYISVIPRRYLANIPQKAEKLDSYVPVQPAVRT